MSGQLLRAWTVLVCLLLLAKAGANECGIEVRFLQSINNVVPGCVTTLQAEILNKSCHQRILVGHLDLPPRWEAIPSNDILLHVDVGQCAIQTLMLRVPDNAEPGEYPIAYEVWARNNMNIIDRDVSAIVIGRPPSDDAPIDLEVTSPQVSNVVPGDLLFITALVTNRSTVPFSDKIIALPPQEWCCFPAGSQDICLEAGESKVLVYAVKVPCDALAGEHTVAISLEGCTCVQRNVAAIVAPKIDVKGRVEGLHDAFALNQQVQLFVRYTNDGNVPINVIVEAKTQPSCRLECSAEPFEIPPGGSCDVPLQVFPEMCELEEYTQFLLVRLIDADSGEQLYQNPMTLKFVAATHRQNDPYIRIPAHYSLMALGDRYKNILAAEVAGGGLVDPDREQYLDFCVRLPTDPNHVLYNVDQRIYAGLYDPEWDLRIGDTVYELSPLTQRFRYGRGGGVQHFDDVWSAGVHYTQNTLESDCNPRQACAYVEYRPCENLGISANYMHLVESGVPTSNIATLEASWDCGEEVLAEAEAGQNFVPRRGGRDNRAYRLAASGKFWGDAWFNVEKVYAGPEFFGYYNHIHLLSGALDCPLGDRWRVNLNINRFVQNFDPCDEDALWAIIPRQHQYNATLTYRISQGSSCALTGLLLRGEDLGVISQYDFYQKWYGASLFLSSCGYNFNAIVSFGQQKDYLTGRTTHGLQRYYCYLYREFSSALSAGLFYDGGNINYYDARPWRSAYGGSMVYRFAPTGCFELFLQKVQQNTDMLDMSQVTCNVNYTFANLHKLQATCQYFKYKSHYPDDTTFLLSYTVPFSLPVCRRGDVGDLGGIVFNTQSNVPVAGALVGCNGSYAVTDECGRFDFPCIARGDQHPKVEMLPDDLILLDKGEMCVELPGGGFADLWLPAVPACTIEGEIMVYGFKDLFAVLIDPQNAEIAETGGIEGMRVAISLEGGQEIYQTSTNEHGRFCFRKLRPGRWHVKLYPDSLTDLQELNVNDLVVEVCAGGCEKLFFKVMPRAPELFRLEE